MSEPTEIQAAMAGLNVLAHSTLSRVMKAGGMDKPTQEHAHGDLADLRALLGWQDAPGLEKLLIEDVVLTWVHRNCCDQYLSQTSTGKDYAQSTVDFFDRRLARAHHRYLSAVMALAKVRRLGINLQVNIAANQVIAGG